MIHKTATTHYGRSQRLIIWAVYIAMFQVVTTNSRQSTLWRLDEERGMIVSGGLPRIRRNSARGKTNHTPSGTSSEDAHGASTEDMLDIITAPTVRSFSASGELTWTVYGSEDMCCMDDDDDVFDVDDFFDDDEDDDNVFFGRSNEVIQAVLSLRKPTPPPPPPAEITCGRTANFTQFDRLAGVKQRFQHPIRPEPEVAYTFMKRKDAALLRKFDMASLERQLRQAQSDNPASAQLYNQIGNYWRIKGDTTKAIECFRKAISMRPAYADAVLNMARALFHQAYLDDAIHLARKSLELKKSSDRSAWRQYLTLGEIFKAYGQFQESIRHLRLALALHPNHERIARVLAEVESIPEVIMQKYTAWFVVCLVVSTMLAILMTGDRALSLSALLRSSVIERQRRLFTGELGDAAGTAEPKRHFNRAMAMRSLKGFARSSRSTRR